MVREKGRSFRGVVGELKGVCSGVGWVEGLLMEKGEVEVAGEIVEGLVAGLGEGEETSGVGVEE